MTSFYGRIGRGKEEKLEKSKKDAQIRWPESFAARGGSFCYMPGVFAECLQVLGASLRGVTQKRIAVKIDSFKDRFRILEEQLCRLHYLLLSCRENKAGALLRRASFLIVADTEFVIMEDSSIIDVYHFYLEH